MIKILLADDHTIFREGLKQIFEETPDMEVNCEASSAHEAINMLSCTECDLVLVGTPIDLRRLINIRHPVERVRYELQVIGRPTLEEILAHRFGH